MKRHLGTAILALCAVWLATSAALAAEPSAPPSVAKPKAVVPEPIKDVGVTPKGEKITHDFVIRNEGTAPLEITEVRPACGCTVADFDKKIAPGQSGKVHVVIDSSTFGGPTQKGVTVFTNDAENPQIELTVRSIVQPLITVDPGYARYVVVQGEPKEGTIVQTLWAEDGAPLNLLKAESPYPFLKVTYHESKPDELLPEGKGKQWKVEMTLSNNAPVGALADYVRITTDHPKQKLVEIPVSGFVRPVIAVTPPVANFDKIELKEPLKRQLVIRAFSTEPIKVTGIESSLKGVDVQLEPLQEGREYRVNLTLKPELAKGPLSGKLIIHTDSPKKPVIEVELKGTVI